MIQTHGLSHDLGGAPILRDVTLALQPGRLTALIGPNGAGKSTLLRLMGRLDRPCRGRITVDGLDLSTTPTQALALRLAILGQQTAIASRLRVAELVGFGRWPHCHGRPGAADGEAVAEALAAFDLTPLADRFLDTLSGGQAQRALIAMTVAQDTPWLLLDEPLNNLDIAHAGQLMARLAALARAGRGVVVVLHDINHAAAWADEVVALKDGRVHATGAVDAVLTPRVLSGLYDTPVEVIRHNGRPLVLHHGAAERLAARGPACGARAPRAAGAVLRPDPAAV